jgi:GT2 family glycosyltransferase
MDKRISVIIPNYNGSLTIGTCLQALYSSAYVNFEVIVVDDSSTDNSFEIIRRFPCNLIRLHKRSGASKARNIGARKSIGEILFFIDADCVVGINTLAVIARATEGLDHTVCGGTYTPLAYDDKFFSTFQSVFINYSETRKEEPDYIASHAMVIGRDIFDNNGGFPEDFMPILEDVEFSHRLRRLGVRLIMNPEILVSHVFNFTLGRSLGNAFRKAKYWTIYSLQNKDLLKDSGTASRELKTNVVSYFSVLLIALLFLFSGRTALCMPMLFILLLNLTINRNFFWALYTAKGLCFAVLATLYYLTVYPSAVGAGSLIGVLNYYRFPSRWVS